MRAPGSLGLDEETGPLDKVLNTIINAFILYVNKKMYLMFS